MQKLREYNVTITVKLKIERGMRAKDAKTAYRYAMDYVYDQLKNAEGIDVRTDIESMGVEYTRVVNED